MIIEKEQNVAMQLRKSHFEGPYFCGVLNSIRAAQPLKKPIANKINYKE